MTPSITGLAAGTYTTDVTVTAAGATGSPKTIPVTFTVDPPTPPALSVTPASLAFTATAGGADPAAKTLAVSNTGGDSMDWTASESATWLSVSPASGTNAGTITVTPSITGLAAGTYTTDVTVTATGATGSPKTIPVTLTVNRAHAAGAHGVAHDARLHRHAGRDQPRGQDGGGHQHGRRHARRHRVRRRRRGSR